DQRCGQLIGFGQCKTGTHWKNQLFELQPTGFYDKWVHTSAVVKPVRLMFLASRVRNHEWFDLGVDGGLLFDRCRILDFAPPMPALRSKWVAWTNAALAFNGLEAWL